MHLTKWLETGLLIMSVLGLASEVKADSVHRQVLPVKSQRKDANAAHFDPCRCSRKIPPSAKKFLKNSMLGLMSTCALNIISILTHSWGPSADILGYLPRALKLICFLIRVSYGAFMTTGDRLPRSLVTNGTVFYDFVDRLSRVALNDTSISSKSCTEPSPPDARVICYDKQQLQQILDFSLPCLRDVLKDNVPEMPEVALVALSNLMKQTTKSAVLTYAGR